MARHAWQRFPASSPVQSIHERGVLGRGDPLSEYRLHARQILAKQGITIKPKAREDLAAKKAVVARGQ